MTLPISSIVTVNVTIAPTVPPKQGFGTAAIVTNENDKLTAQQTSRIRFYNNIDGVGDDWANTTEVYKAALAYFSQEPAPTTVAVIAHYDQGTTGTLTGANSADSTVGNWTSVVDGEFSIAMSGVEKDVVALNFTGAADMDAIAAIIETGIQGADAAWAAATVDWVVDHFFIDNKVLGGAMAATKQAAVVAGTDISLVFMQTDDALIGNTPAEVITVQGVNAETEVDALEAGEGASADWYGVILLKGVRDTQVQLDVAAWTEARTKLYSAATNNPASLSLGDIDNNAHKLSIANYTRTCCTYSSVAAEYPDAAVLGKAFPTNFDAPDSAITLKFKPLAGITTENLTATQKNGLDDKRANALISVGSAPMYAEGFMAGQLFFDERHGIDWLVGEIESNVFGYLLSRPTKVPLTDKGGAALEQQLIRALDAALSNGLLGTGTTSTGVFLGTGYSTTVQKVADMNIADKANRISPTISFVALLAGAVHFVQINGVVER